MKGSSSKSNKSIDYKIIALGVLGAYTMTFILFVILSLLLYITELSESLIPSLVMAISAISILVCGISVTRNVSNLGWLHGGIIGVIYVALLLVVGRVTGNGEPLGLTILIDLGLGFLAGTLSGVLGVNL